MTWTPISQIDSQSILQQQESLQEQWLEQINAQLQPLLAQQRVAWALANLPAPAILSSSFGIQSAAMLHLLTQQQSDIPVVLIDTGYLFFETYRFIDELTERLQLNLRVYRAQNCAAWQEARHGQRWISQAGLKEYNYENKVEPMQRALQELGAQSWFTGLRRSQSSTRVLQPFVEIHRGVVKIAPIVDWSDRDIFYYLKEHQLPHHPLWQQGYVSVGDTHSTRKFEAGMSVEDTRFNGLVRECGLHL